MTEKMRRLLIGGATLTAVAVVGLGIFAAYYVPSAGWSSNDITTGKHPGYPDLQPRRYDMPIRDVAAYAAAVISKTPRWKLMDSDPENGVVTAEVTVFPLPFTDDVTITVTPDDAEGKYSRVVVRSHSRVGKADMGENARHIRLLLAEMDKRLPAAP